MSSTTLKLLGNALLAAALTAAVAGCATKKTDDSGQASTATATPPPAEAPAEQPAFTPAPMEAQPATPIAAIPTSKPASAAPATAPVAVPMSSGDGFENDPALYSGSTATRTVYFGFDKSDIPSAAYATLKAHARHLAGNAAAKLTIEGHCDERGTPEYNIALGERRAKTLKDFLVLNGAKSDQIELVSLGEEKPAELGHDDLSWAKNRRGELNYTAGKP